jgi:hypothetical protein
MHGFPLSTCLLGFFIPVINGLDDLRKISAELLYIFLALLCPAFLGSVWSGLVWSGVI